MVTHDRVFCLKPKFVIDEKEGIFIASCFHFLTKEFDYSHMCTWEKIKNLEILLPVCDDGIDLNFMDNCVSEIELDYISEMEIQRNSEIKAYLDVSGVNSFVLEGDEKILIDNFDSLMWKKFKVIDLFKISSSKRIFHANNIDEINSTKKEGSHPYIVRATTNNGLKGYIVEDESYLNPVPSLSFAQDTFSVYYQKEKYFTGNKVKVLIPTFDFISENTMLFIATALNVTISKNSWGIGSTIDSIAELEIELPVANDNCIDFKTMDKLVSAIKKMAFSDSIGQADLILNAAKLSINQSN